MCQINMWLLGFVLMIMSTHALAKTNCNKDVNTNKTSQALAQYILESENIARPWVFKTKQYDYARKISIETFDLASQFWPKVAMSPHGILWKHTLVIYRPDTVTTTQALLFINGGTRLANLGGDTRPSSLLDFARLAEETHSIVVNLQDIPNQYLLFDDGIPRKEDRIVAYTWNRYMDNPDEGMYWPIHLPMTKAVIKAMDAVQAIVAKNSITVNSFVVAGASKRGLTTWLAALSDKRINAIVPIVIDILNTQENLHHIYTSYNNSWPPAFHQYIEEKIPDRIHTIEFCKLMNIEDPLSYLTGPQGDFYKKRLSIPKYIISASGDDFFVPDSLNLYLDKLPGETHVRVLPNQAHYVDMRIIEGSLLAFYKMIINQIPRPSLKWVMNENNTLLNVTVDKKPSSVTLWEAENPDRRDFRFAAHITYSAKTLKGNCVDNHCQYSVTMKPPLKGWKASFVEIVFPESHDEPLVLTTSTYIVKASN